MKITTIPIAVYHEELFFIYDCDVQEACEYLNEKYPHQYIEPYGECCKGFYAVRTPKGKGYNNFYICLPTKNNNNAFQQICALSHEIMHICFTMLGRKGMEVSPESEEAYCYLLSYLMEECLNALAKNLKEK